MSLVVVTTVADHNLFETDVLQWQEIVHRLAQESF